jgi:1-acyl-sn-glycerol-3-phosphate acyltransferase
MGSFLIKIVDFFKSHKTVYFVALVAVGLLISAGIFKLKIEEDVSKMLPNAGDTASILQAMQSSKIADKLVILVNGQGKLSTDSIEIATESLAENLQDSLGNLISSVRYKADDDNTADLLSLINEHPALFLEENDYKTLDSIIAPAAITTALENDYKILSSATGIVMGRQVLNDPIGISNIALRKLSVLKINDNVHLQNGYLYTPDGKSILMLINPNFGSNENAKNEQFVHTFKSISSNIEKQFPNIKIQYYGAAFVAESNATQLKKDTLLTLSITIIGLVAFILFYFKRKRITLLVFLPIIFGIAFALGIIGFTIGHISTIAIAAGCVVMGIGINYSIHFIHHYKHSQSVTDTIKELLIPLSIGSFTTIASLFSLTFVESPILNDFGRFSAWSLIGTSIFTLLFLPILLPAMKDEKTIIERIAEKTIHPNKWFAFAICIITVFLLFFVNDVQFESDLNQLSYQNEELKANEKAIQSLQGGKVKTVYITSRGADLSQALAVNHQLYLQLEKAKDEKTIKRFSSLAPFLMDEKEQQKKAAYWNTYWTKEKANTLKENILKSASLYGFKPNAFDSFYEKIDAKAVKFTDNQNQFIREIIGAEQLSISDSGTTILSSISIEIDKRDELYKSLASVKGVTILDKQIITNSLIKSVLNDFNRILLYCSLIVFVALYLSYGRLEIAIITFIPMALSWIWILGIMGLLGLKFNIVNMVIATFIFGLGDDFSIFITDALNQKLRFRKDVLSSHKTAIILASVTTLLGLGALIFAKHPALQSIAWLSILGLVSVVLIGQTIQPLLYNFFLQNRIDKGIAPWTIKTLFFAIIAFTYFVFWSLILSFVGFILIYALPFPSRQKRQYWFHFMLSKFVKSLVYLMANVKKVHINKELTDFSTPSIIISNHQSFLDILVTVMQHPKLILLTNEWVYNSPFFGKVVQMADYFPVAEGAEMGIERLRKKVSKGYSVVIFPEGTRSKDGIIKRFKKGAFFLSEQLQLDIQPLLLHGIGDTMGKGDFMLYDGQMTMKYLPRIRWNDNDFGKNYTEKTKNISSYFKAEYEVLKSTIEKPIYYKQRLELNYVYKGPIAEWYVKEKIRIDRYYSLYHEHIPLTATITDLGCGYGMMAYLLRFMSPARIITGVDFDEEKIAIAQHNFSKNQQLNFVASDVLKYNFKMQDIFVINDVLHYLKPEEQEILIKKCTDHLSEDGFIILKDADVMLEKGQKLTWFSEFLSINLGFNKKPHDELYFTSSQILSTIAMKLNLDFQPLVIPKYSSNTVWKLKKKT